MKTVVVKIVKQTIIVKQKYGSLNKFPRGKDFPPTRGEVTYEQITCHGCQQLYQEFHDWNQRNTEDEYFWVVSEIKLARAATDQLPGDRDIAPRRECGLSDQQSHNVRGLYRHRSYVQGWEHLLQRSPTCTRLTSKMSDQSRTLLDHLGIVGRCSGW